jgi:hypothetical protein
MTTPCKVVTTALLLLGLLSGGAFGQGAGKSDPEKTDKAPAGGDVTFIQNGGYAVDCRVTWKQQVKDKTGKSNLEDKEWTWKGATHGMRTRCDLPLGATDVKVSVEVRVSRDMLREIKLEPKEFATPPRVTYTLTGTVLDAKAKAQHEKIQAIEQPAAKQPNPRADQKPASGDKAAEQPNPRADQKPASGDKLDQILERLERLEKRVDRLEGSKPKPSNP